ncbi:MAG: AAA family ATPase [Spirochaetales bacterium]|nr:AAA family ATPase [Spirochaetales bacterium]
MLLKSLELFGFKSFADKAVIEFSGGVSALLGPNGCGKSNIVDAIKWVLGEQATKSLRADRMEDVIFNGTEDRKALNVADVILTLSNDDGRLPIDTAEIAIRRRLFRNGESEYFINGASVRLRDLRELFYDTGIGKTAYSIMEQGKIDQVLSNRPEERRLIFEEAAGITKYRLRGREAERKLERTEDNMRQVQSILGEVRRSHDSLKKQSDKTLRYRKLREEAFDVELDLTLFKLRDHVESRDKRSEQVEQKTTARDKIKAAIDAINENLEENLDVVNAMETRLIEHQKRLYGVELERGNKQNQIRLHNERVGEFEEKIRNDELRRGSLEEKVASLREEVVSLRTAAEEHGVRIADVAKNIVEFEERIAHAEGRISANVDAARALGTEITTEEDRVAEIEIDLTALTDDIVRKLDEELAASGYSRSTRLRSEKELRTALSALSSRVQHRITLLEDLKRAGAGSPDAVISSGLDGLHEIEEMAEHVATLTEQFAASIPAFLDEFLAPEGIITRKRNLETDIGAARNRIRECREQIGELEGENAELSARMREYRHTLEELRVNRAGMQAQFSAMERTIGEREKAISEEEQRLELHSEELAASHTRLAHTVERIEALESEISSLSEKENELQNEQDALEKSISSRNADLIQKERSLKRKMEDLGKTQQQLERVQMNLAETNAEVRSLYENFRERFSRELSEFEPRMLELKDSGSDLRRHLAELRETERSLGAVNLMAPEEFEEVKQRFEFLDTQLTDLRRAKEDLRRVTEEIQNESAALFTESYEGIKKNFHVMFRRLFGGGRAELKLVDPDAVLDSGIEILAQPPGKKLENISLLSGGERSLTAVALLFATYMVRPSPFCLLDEIDAALDESNVGRFTNMLLEFGQSSQFIIITHNKKTVASASTLLGITMEDSGVSKVISIRVGGREEVGVS